MVEVLATVAPEAGPLGYGLILRMLGSQGGLWTASSLLRLALWSQGVAVGRAGGSWGGGQGSSSCGPDKS